MRPDFSLDNTIIVEHSLDNDILRSTLPTVAAAEIYTGKVE